ncbi:hypothetical protein Poli38472_009820 [Pythium oligandrum]|uniref:Uncharacterized protein n=1 Tax=Pythium oligandrum TaxID=41045 RepID=A0A8K1FK02_PYTOL|nr:hypothetical protein Poli38472_009820 [Pythium oligandrum]|eukprot:TMW62327.1 hypothetical protein Poli38472_009820 [Pythium oligandrum]
MATTNMAAGSSSNKRMKRRRAESLEDGMQMEVDACSYDYAHDAEDDAEEEARSHKRSMLIRSNLRFLEKVPPIRDYQRDRSGRRGAIDGGDLTGAVMLSALEESFEETSFVTREPPARVAMVMPVPVPIVPVMDNRPDVHASRSPEHGRIRQTPQSSPLRSLQSPPKDDEARPASE